MTIALDCPNCGKNIRTEDSSAGKRSKCPSCGEAIVIPGDRAAGTVADPSEQDDPDPRAVEAPQSAMPPLALALSIGAALLGVALWAVILSGARSEIGWLAWGIGGLVGMSAAKGGGRGVPMAATAALLAVLSIFGGKWLGLSIITDREFEKATQDLLVSPEMEPLYREMQLVSGAWTEFTEPPSDEVLARFMVDHGFTEATDATQVIAEELAYFRDEHAPELERFAADQPTREEWDAEIVEDMNEYRSDVDITEAVVDDLGLLDILFVGLGISTAWGLVMRNSANSSGRRRRRHGH